MREVAERLKDLVVLLEGKLLEVGEKERELAASQKSVKAEAAENFKVSQEIIAREKAIAMIENVAAVSAATKASLIIISKTKAENEALLKDILATKQALASREKELSELMTLYRAKNQGLENEKVQLEKDKKEMRSKILEELKKLK